MCSRVRELLGELVGKSKGEKGVGFLRTGPKVPDANVLLEQYFDAVMVFGFYRFYPEIFIPEGGPLRHKGWEDQITYERGEKAVRRFVMRFVRFICEEHVLIPGESGDLGHFPIFADWRLQGEDGCYTKQQNDIFVPPHLHALGWYLENVPDVHDFINASDRNLHDGVLAGITKVRNAPLEEKAQELAESLDRIEKSQADGDGEMNTVGQIFRPSSALASAIAGRTAGVYVPRTSDFYGPVLFTELQEIIASRKGKTTTELDNIAADVAGVVSDVAAMVSGRENVDLENEEEGARARQTSLVKSHNLRPRGERPQYVAGEGELATQPAVTSSQKKPPPKGNRKGPKSEPDGTQVKFLAQPVHGVDKTVKLSMNISMERFLEGIGKDVFFDFLNAVKQVSYPATTHVI